MILLAQNFHSGKRTSDAYYITGIIVVKSRFYLYKAYVKLIYINIKYALNKAGVEKSVISFGWCNQKKPVPIEDIKTAKK